MLSAEFGPRVHLEVGLGATQSPHYFASLTVDFIEGRGHSQRNIVMPIVPLVDGINVKTIMSYWRRLVSIESLYATVVVAHTVVIADISNRTPR